MSARQTPRLMAGGLSGAIYCVTRYKVLRKATATETELIEAIEKHDVTADFFRLAAVTPIPPDFR